MWVYFVSSHAGSADCGFVYAPVCVELWAQTMQRGWSHGLPAIPVPFTQISSIQWTCAFALQNTTSKIAPTVTLTWKVLVEM